MKLVPLHLRLALQEAQSKRSQSIALDLIVADFVSNGGEIIKVPQGQKGEK